MNTPRPSRIDRFSRRKALAALLGGAAALCCLPGTLMAQGAVDLALEAQNVLTAGNALQAIPLLERAKAMAGGADLIWIRGLLARAYYVGGRSQDAVKEVEAVLELEPKEPLALMLRERLLAERAVGVAAPAPGSALSLRRMVLDPGHGGLDPGAVGNGLQEKEVVLDIARRCARILDNTCPGLKTQLTREDDYYIPLEARAVAANYYEADLFVSLHANAHHDAAARGLETFRCTERPTSAQAAAVAARENRIPQQEGAQSDSPLFVDIEDILFRFERAQAWRKGERVARRLQDGLAASLPLKDRGVHGANFAVLRKARMPAVLVEVGFISNPDEAGMLSADNGRERVAAALAQALGGMAQRGVA